MEIINTSSSFVIATVDASRMEILLSLKWTGSSYAMLLLASIYRPVTDDPDNPMMDTVNRLGIQSNF